jgi:dTDP-4-dehydrorhamnose 3,5-epimerase
MIFKDTKLEGAYLIIPEKNQDKRGFFARTFCKEEFKKKGIDFDISQCSISFNKKKGTLRGMHYQKTPYEEAKLVSCSQGRIYDVIIDMRKGSKTYCKWYAVELSADNYKLLYIPKGFAHGFQALEDNSVVLYHICGFYRPGSAKGIRWDDAKFNISWPLEDKIISKKDKLFKEYC